MKPTAWPATIPEMLYRQAQARPDAQLLFERRRDGRWQSATTRACWEEVLGAARGLFLLGLRPGERVAILARTSRKWQLAEWAALSAWATVVGLEPFASSAHLCRCLEDARVSVIVAEDRESLEALPAAASTSRTSSKAARACFPSPVPCT